MILCPVCRSKTRVLEMRATPPDVRRRRGCSGRSCNGKVTTVEVVVPDGRANALARKIVASIERGAL